MLVKYAVHVGFVCLSVFFAGCAWLRPENPQVAAKCTSISNVVGKNYRLGARVNYLLAGVGVNFERSGVTLTNEAAERQLDLDRLCRMWATKGMSDDKWAETYTQYIVASSVAAARTNDPEVARQLEENLTELQTLLTSLGTLRPDSLAAQNVPSIAVLKKAIDDSQQQLDKDISAKLTAIADSLGAKLAGTNSGLVEEYKARIAAQETQQAQLLSSLSGLQLRLFELEKRLQPTPPKPQPEWVRADAFRVTFEYSKFALSDEAKVKLKLSLSELSRDVDYRIELFGYTDSSGAPSSHAALSRARAEEVRDYLVDVLNLNPAKIFPQGRQRGVSKFGPNPENRAVEVRAMRLVALPESIDSAEPK